MNSNVNTNSNANTLNGNESNANASSNANTNSEMAEWPSDLLLQYDHNANGDINHLDMAHLSREKADYTEAKRNLLSSFAFWGSSFLIAIGGITGLFGFLGIGMFLVAPESDKSRWGVLKGGLITLFVSAVCIVLYIFTNKTSEDLEIRNHLSSTETKIEDLKNFLATQ